MIQPNKSQKQTEKKDKSNFEPNEIEYKLNLSSQIVDSLEKFCERLEISRDSLGNLLLKMHLEEIESGIDLKNYELLILHFSFSNLLEQKSEIGYEITNKRFNQKIALKIKREIERVIVEICDAFRKISPKRFIEEAIEYQFNAIIDNIRRGYYEFLENFNKFSDILKKFKILRKKGETNKIN